MYKVKKVLNHNSVIAVETNELVEYLIMGKGVGFGMKPTQELKLDDDCKVFSLAETSERGDVKDIVKHVDPVYLEMAEAVLQHAEEYFDSVDHNILFPMADHLEYAAKRIQNNDQIINPLLNDIKLLFYNEYKAAEIVKDLFKDNLGLDMMDDEIGYVAMHIHSATSQDKLSQTLETAHAVRNCITKIEDITGRTIPTDSFSYNRMMNHIRYMVARIQKHEDLKIDMNDYVSTTFPESFKIAAEICHELSKSLGSPTDEMEIGYLAMHIERVKADVLDS